jgi:hypothetical protein
MRIHTAPNHQLPCITVDYHLMMSSTSPGLFLGDEPIALCRVRLAQAVPIGGEECQLVAWHFAAGEMPIAMPIEETCECVEGEWTGRFLLLPRRDLTLVLVDGSGQTYSLAQLSLQPTAPSASHRSEEDTSTTWIVAVVWSDGIGVAFLHRWSIFLATRVRELSLTETQCSAALLLGCLLRSESQVDGSPIGATIVCPTEGGPATGFALYVESSLPGGVGTSTRYPQLHEALEQGGIDLGACWLLLPALCQGCQLPILSEAACVLTLWGRMHPACVGVSQGREAVDIPPAQARERVAGSGPATGVEEGQLVFPWAS